MTKKKKLRRPCKTCKNLDCSCAGYAYGKRFICSSYKNPEEIEEPKDKEDFLEKLKRDLQGSPFGFPFILFKMSASNDILTKIKQNGEND